MQISHNFNEAISLEVWTNGMPVSTSTLNTTHANNDMHITKLKSVINTCDSDDVHLMRAYFTIMLANPPNREQTPPEFRVQRSQKLTFPHHS